MRTHRFCTTTKRPSRIEAHTMANWIARGTVTVTETGEENTYAVDQFGNEFYAKDVLTPADAGHPDNVIL